MTWITFIKDVRPDDEPGGAPLYKSGYSCDVSEKEAQRCIRQGMAHRGKNEKPAPVKFEAEKEADTKETPSFRSRASKSFTKKSSGKGAAD